MNFSELYAKMKNVEYLLLQVGTEMFVLKSAGAVALELKCLLTTLKLWCLSKCLTGECEEETNARARLMGEKKVRRRLEGERTVATAQPPRIEEKDAAGPAAIAASRNLCLFYLVSNRQNFLFV